MSLREKLHARIEELEIKHEKQIKIISSLKERVKKTIRNSGDAYSVFERNIVLKEEVNLQKIGRTHAEATGLAKTQFLSSMSHELRTPMNAIIGFGELLSLDEGLSVSQKENVGEIVKASDHLMELINEILDLSKVEAGEMELVLTAVEVDPVIRECMMLIGKQAMERGICIKHNEQSTVCIYADRTRFKQVMLNLLSNAVKYNKDAGEIIVKSHIVDQSYLCIEVTDTGHGICTEQFKDLFKPFRRLGKEYSNVEGTGLGLMLTKQLVELMNGTVEVRSEVGKGTTFGIKLPLSSRPL
ncbi:MAG: HAMP domain-containing sensor histidine kinase [Cycloclasticus sp.]